MTLNKEKPSGNNYFRYTIIFFNFWTFFLCRNAWFLSFPYLSGIRYHFAKFGTTGSTPQISLWGETGFFFFFFITKNCTTTLIRTLVSGIKRFFGYSDYGIRSDFNHPIIRQYQFTSSGNIVDVKLILRTQNFVKRKYIYMYILRCTYKT